VGGVRGKSQERREASWDKPKTNPSLLEDESEKRELRKVKNPEENEGRDGDCSSEFVRRHQEYLKHDGDDTRKIIENVKKMSQGQDE